MLEHVPAGGLNLWLRLPAGTDVPDLVHRCDRAGLSVADGADWFPAEPSAPYLRLGFAGPRPSDFGAGARILGRVPEAGPGGP